MIFFLCKIFPHDLVMVYAIVIVCDTNNSCL